MLRSSIVPDAPTIASLTVKRRCRGFLLAIISPSSPGLQEHTSMLLWLSISQSSSVEILHAHLLNATSAVIRCIDSVHKDMQTPPFSLPSPLPMAARHMLLYYTCLLYTSPSPRDGLLSRMPSSA